MHSLNVLRSPGICFELLPQPCDVNIHGACRRCGVVAPDGVEELVAGVDGTLIFDEVLEELEFQCGEFQ